MSIFAPLMRLSDLLTYRVLGMQPGTHAAKAVWFFLYDAPKVLLLLITVIATVTCLRTYLPRARVRTLLAGRNRLTGHMLAGVTGIITPFCTCSAIPLFLGFLEAGVPLGVTFTFLIASPMINEIAVGLLLGVFGWRIALLYVGSGLLIAILAGMLIGALRMESLVRLDDLQEGKAFAPASFASQRDRWAFARRVTAGILRKVWLFVLLGIAVGALIHGFAPADFLAGLSQRSGLLAVPVATLTGIPLYSNAAGILPMVAALVEKGLPLGTALAFLMSVTALSLPEFLILRRVIATRLLVLFALTVGSGILLTGYLFNAVLG